jgi:hypothetical protein
MENLRDVVSRVAKYLTGEFRIAVVLGGRYGELGKEALRTEEKHRLQFYEHFKSLTYPSEMSDCFSGGLAVT